MKRNLARREDKEVAGNLRHTAFVAVVVLGLAIALLWLGTYGARLLVQRRVADREANVINTLRTLSDALTTYQQKYGGYPDTLARLAGKEDGPADYLPPERARLLERAFAQDRIELDRYVITYTPTGAGQTWAATVPLVGGYVIEGQPVAAGSSGMNFYYSDQTRAIRLKRGAPAGPEDRLAPPSS